jgi:hypothetical protein
LSTTATTTANPTAKDFQAPLLRALFAWGLGKPRSPVPFKNTYEPICTEMGITLEQYGVMDGGKEKVAQWIQWAHKNLKRTGHVVDIARGQWALSDAGVAEVRNMNSTSTPATPVASPAPAVTLAKQTPKVAGVPSPVSPGHPDAGYHSDPYIRSLGAQSTPCFGHYSHKSGTCERCPLQGPCINFLAAELSRLATVLQREDDEAARRAAQPKQPKPATNVPAPVAAPPASNFDWTEWNTDKVRNIIAKAQGTCPACGKPVAKGASAVWLRANVAQGGRKRAKLFHRECGPKG